MIKTGSSGKAKKFSTFRLEVLFLTENFHFEEQTKQVENLANFVSHPRVLASSANQQNMKVQQSIYACLQQFRTAERLGSNDSWYCSRCKKHVAAYKNMEIYKTPPILIFSFNRFKA